MTFDRGNIFLSEDKANNFIQLDNEDFHLFPLNVSFETSKGASSNLFVLNDPTDEMEDRVIKICKFPLSRRRNGRIERFKREVRAFGMAKKNGLHNVIEFFKSGTVKIAHYDFMYLIMEKADEDLASFLERKRFDFTTNEKLSFCLNILNGIKQLHSIGIYHRDIKHDNILLVNNEFKIGDLGLIRFQNEDFRVDQANEKIGPFGWHSPEATNKVLTNMKKMVYKYDCDIDFGSDIFQLGKLFWYVFQGNLPIGQILLEDYKINEDDIFQVIFSMLQYKKSRRPSIKKIEDLFEPLRIKYVA